MDQSIICEIAKHRTFLRSSFTAFCQRVEDYAAELLRLEEEAASGPRRHSRDHLIARDEYQRAYDSYREAVADINPVWTFERYEDLLKQHPHMTDSEQDRLDELKPHWQSLKECSLRLANMEQDIQIQENQMRLMMGSDHPTQSKARPQKPEGDWKWTTKEEPGITAYLLREPPKGKAGRGFTLRARFYRPCTLTHPVLWFDVVDSADHFDPREDDRLLRDVVLVIAGHDYSTVLKNPDPIAPIDEYQGRFLRDTFLKDLWRKVFKDDDGRMVGIAWKRVKAGLPEATTAEEQGSQETGEEDKTTVAILKQRRYVFKCEGATWRIRYEGQQTTVLDSLGVKYIYHLLQNQGKTLECSKIEGAWSSEAAEDHVPIVGAVQVTEAGLHTTTTFDLKKLEQYDIDDIKRAITHLEDKIKQESDPARKNEWKMQRYHLQEYLRKNTNLQGQPLSVDGTERARNRVQHNINAAKRAILAKNEQIGQHFKLNVVAHGTTYTYSPDPVIDWILI